MSFDSCIPIELITDGTPITYGVVQPGPEDANGVLFIRGGDISDGRINTSSLRTISRELSQQYKRTLLKGGELVISLVGNPGEVAIVPNVLKGANIARQVGLVRVDKNRFHPRFVQYYLMSPAGKAQLFSYSLGSVQSVINLKELKRVEIPSFSLENQEEIVKCLGEVDDKIGLNRRINQTLEAMAQAIFKSWFVDFDPVKAKIAAIERGQDPLRAAMRAISGKTDAELDQMPREHHDQLAATAALFPDAMEESELGEIPKGWEISTIGEMVEIAGGATPDTKKDSYWNPPEHFWTSPKDLSGAQSPVLLATERKISTTGLSRIGSGLLPKGTLLMSSRAPIGYLAITQIPVAINQGYIAMLPGGKLPPLYLLMWCQQNMEEIKGQANGSTFMEISKKAFRPMRVIYPGPNLMDRFVETVTSLFGQIVEGVKESSQLSELRDTLLPKLLSGELSATARSKEMELDP